MISFLLKLNNKLYNYYFHLPLFLILISGLLFSTGFLKLWIFLGFVFYIIMAIIRFKSFDKSSLLGILVGFNLFLLFGPSIFLLMLLLKNKNE